MDVLLNAGSGSFTAVNSNLPGILKKDALNARAWRTDSGKWFVPISDAAWMLFGSQNPESIQYWQQFVQDDAAHGINVMGPIGMLGSSGTDAGPVNGNNDPWQSIPSLDFTRYDLSKFQTAESRLIWILNNYPDLFVQSVLLGTDQQFSWSAYSQSVRNNTMDYMIARWSAFPNLYWVISKDQDASLNATLNFNREVGHYFEDHEPWKHLLSTEFHKAQGFPLTAPDDLTWLDYVSIQDPDGPGATQIQKFNLQSVPVQIELGEDIYEESSRTYSDPRFYFRWGEWSWILSGGAYNYGGRWETIHPYSQTGRTDLRYVDSSSGINWTGQQLRGLDSNAYVWPYFQSRNIDLSLFQPNDSLVTAWAMLPGDTWRPKLARRGNEEFLVYDPNAFSEGAAADVDQTRIASMTMDLTSVSGNFVVEWYRPYDGVAQNGGTAQGGGSLTFVAPWQGYDVVLRIVKSNPDVSPPTISITSPTNNSTVSDTITITASASDNIGVAGVQFQLDGVNYGMEDITVPYSIPWDTKTAIDGSSHTITATARDAAGNTATASPVSVIVSNPDRTPPAAPANLVATIISTSQVNLSWTASTDNIAVTGYRVERCQGNGCTNFAEIAAPTQTSYGDQAVAAGSYNYRVRAADAAGNLSGYSSIVNALTASGLSYGLEWPGDGAVRRMLYWHNPFPIYDATYIFKVYPRKKTTGTSRYYTTFFWGNDGRFDWDSGGSPNTYYGAHPYPIPPPTGPGQWEISVNSNDYVTGTEVQWDRWYTQAFRTWRESPSITHHEFYWDWPDTSKVITQTVVDPQWANKNPPIPAIVMGQAPDYNGASWGGYPGWEEFNGIIRGIQIYSGLLPMADIQSEITAPKSTQAGQNLMWYLNLNPRPNDVTDKKVTGILHNPSWSGTTALEWADQAAPPDTTPPSTPTNLTATTVSSSQINLSWTASTDNVGVGTYIVERCQGTNCATFNQIATPGGTFYNDASLASATSYSYRVRAKDAAGNLSGNSNVATATTNAAPPPDTTPPTAPSNLVAIAINTSQINLSWTSSTDNVGVTTYLLERCQGTACSNFAQIATPTGASYNDTGLAAGASCSYRVRAADAAGNLSGYSSVTNATTKTLAAAFAFDEGTGLTTADASGNGMSGTLTNGPVWTPGKNGNALSFDGVDDKVSLPSTLDIAALPFTVEAWVRPANFSIRHVIFSKRNSFSASGMRFDWALQSSTGRVIIRTSASTITFTYAPPLNTWTHVAAVADSTGTKLYANGVLQQTLGVVTLGTGAAAAANIGRTGDNADPFAGLLDDLRLYKRALSDVEIQSDMNRPVGSTPDTDPPGVPAGLNASAVSASQINLSWTASTDNVGVTGYRIERCDGMGCTNFAQIGTSTSTLYSDTGLAAGASYSYRIRATDAAANVSGYSNTASAVTNPPPPANFTAAASGGTQINLTWTASASVIGILNYQVERCLGAGCSTFAQIATPAATSYADTGLTPATAYSYRVRAVDTNNTLSGYSSTASATTADTIPPGPPSNLAAIPAGATQINLTWTASTDNVGVTGYRLERCQDVSCTTFAQIATPAAATYSDINLTASTSYSYRVRATDAAGNLSGYSNSVSATTGKTPPTAPANLTVAASGGTQINLTWTPSTSSIGILNYQVERCQGAGCSNFVQIGAPATASYADMGLTPATAYSYRVRASDTESTLSAYSNTAATTTADTVPPSAPSNLTTAVAGTAQINLTWTASTDNVGVTGYQLERCRGVNCTTFAQIATPANASYSDTGLTAGTSYSYRVRATDAATNLGVYSNIASATTIAAAPANLIATASGGTQINLSWTASTSSIGILNYQLERCPGAGCSNFIQVATPTDASYVDTALTPATSYSYRVRARDTNNNSSAYSNIATAATADTVAPSVPLNLTATAVSTSQINLVWTASTDNVGVTGYQLERCQGSGCSTFVQIATPTAASYNNTGLAPATSYSYRVRAADAVGNLSGYSNVATAATPATPPANGPAAAYAFNEGTGSTTADASGNGFTGTLTNGALWTTGKNGNAVSFDGVDDKVSLPATLDIAALPFSLEAWVRPANRSSWHVIFSKRSSYSAAGMRFDVGLQASDGRVYVTTYRSEVTFTYAPPLNTWTHLAVVADSTGTRLYVNGALQQTLATITLGTGSSAAVNIGRTGDNSDPFAGMIDDLRLYKRALSLAEIQSDMNTGVF